MENNNELVWNVYISDFNAKNIKQYNIFDHYSFREDCKKAAKKKGITFDEFKKEIKTSLTYFFWSKCEWEIILEDWPPHESFNKKKIDVCHQVMMNFDQFITYLWNNKEKI